jgi:hypothetical protein
MFRFMRRVGRAPRRAPQRAAVYPLKRTGS